MPNYLSFFPRRLCHVLALAPSIMALGGAPLLLGAAAPVENPNAATPVSEIKAAEAARVPLSTAHDAATLAAALDANRIAEDGIAAQIEATRWQILLGIGALVLSVIAALAAVAAAIYARLAWQANQRSADVAERMLTGYERPFLLLEMVQSGIILDGRSITFGVTKYQFRNLGRVPALIMRRHFELECCDEMPAPIDPQKEIGQAIVHGVAVAANAASDELEAGSALPLLSALRRSQEVRSRDKRGKTSVYFHGFVEYRDLAGRCWITGFCFAHSDNEVGFQPLSLAERDGPDPYNYDRQIG